MTTDTTNGILTREWHHMTDEQTGGYGEVWGFGFDAIDGRFGVVTISRTADGRYTAYGRLGRSTETNRNLYLGVVDTLPEMQLIAESWAARNAR
jgi:hypothetical protein